MYITKDVTFHEVVFPFSQLSNTDSTCPLPNIIPEGEHEDTDTIQEEQDTEISNIDSPIAPRRSTRISTKPTWMKDFICNSSEDATSVSDLTLTHKQTYLVENLCSMQEPRDYKEAQGKPEWEEVMQQEIDALERNNTWEVSTLPPGKNCVGCKWIFKLKLKPDGTLERCKARLVAKGYSQKEGEDYGDCFAPVAKAVTVRTFLRVAAARKWPLHHLDVNNAFLHGTLDEEIYMKPPNGYEILAGKVCKLNKSLYGLKQASRQWNQQFIDKITEFGFIQSAHDHCLFIKHTKSHLIALLVYVDDIFVTAPSNDLIMEVKGYLNELSTIKDLGVAAYFLDTGHLKSKATTAPLPAGCKLSMSTGAALQDPSRYRRLIGRLLYLGFTRPDICYAAQQLSQHLQYPCQSHWEAAMHLIKYLKGNPSAGSPISWRTKKQTTVARSSAEAEYRSMAATTCEISWVMYLLADLRIPIHTPIPFYCDNKSVLHITTNPVFHERTKHLEIDCHVVRNKYKEGIIQPCYIMSKQQVADSFTKVLTGNVFLHLRSKLGMITTDPCLTREGSVKTDPTSNGS
ncbi:UNVERIFIED_CONTAM: Retrovirus-related Pol polyprotein from transposon RE1 [Sesamum indicum]